ncbi:MAG: Sapep family Mn(2+)-dependent dipeptidase [Faecalibacterium sp.]
MPTTPFTSKIDAFIAANESAILSDIAKLIAIDSVQTAAAPSAPFGAGAKAALDETLSIATRLGLATQNCENYIGYAEVSTEHSDPEKHLATICHVDVVPVGNGWNSDPFEMILRDGWMIGRGVADDKAPMIACLYALKFLQDEGVSLRYPIRALIGTNEETGMEDVEYYLKNYTAPVFCFTPDAEFPVCNGEKGHFHGSLTSIPSPSDRIIAFAGGVAVNAVPDLASALVMADISTLPSAEYITLSAEGGDVRVSAQGKAGHAAMPEGTRNAIGLVANYLLGNDLCSAAERDYLSALALLHAGHDGAALGIASEDEPFGKLTIIGGTIAMQDGVITQTMDCRFPTSTSGDAIIAGITAAIAPFAAGVSLTHCDAGEPFYISADTPAIRACIDTFNEVTGQQATPFTMGGGTYAKHFPYAVSFGPEHADTVLPEFGGPMHGANEAAPVDKLLEALKIYILALVKLEELDF